MPEQLEQAPAQEQKPEGWEQVDFEKDDRQKIEQRFHRTYGQLKRIQGEQKATNATVKERVGANKVMLERLTEREAKEQAKVLEGEISEAAKVGDGEKVATLTSKLIDLKSTPKAPAQVEQKPEKDPETDDPLADLMPEQRTRLDNWAREVNEDGSPKRPWFAQGHEEYESAVWHLAGMLKNPKLTDNPDAMMSRMDELMGLKVETKSVVKRNIPTVLENAGATRRSGNSGPTQAQVAAAEAMGVKIENYMKIVGEQTLPDGKMNWKRISKA